jgi:hypothetical protein
LSFPPVGVSSGSSDFRNGDRGEPTRVSVSLNPEIEDRERCCFAVSVGEVEVRRVRDERDWRGIGLTPAEEESWRPGVDSI